MIFLTTQHNQLSHHSKLHLTVIVPVHKGLAGKSLVLLYATKNPELGYVLVERVLEVFVAVAEGSSSFLRESEDLWIRRVFRTLQDILTVVPGHVLFQRLRLFLELKLHPKNSNIR